MLTKKEIEDRQRAKRRNMTQEEYLEGYTQMLEQPTPRTRLHAKWELLGTGTPVEVLEYELHDARKVARIYRSASLTVFFLFISYIANLSAEVIHVPAWGFPLLSFLGGVVITVSIFMNSSIRDIHYALEAERELNSSPS